MAALALKTLLPEADAPIIRPRVDLRTGLVACGVLDREDGLEALGRALKTARRAWSGAGFIAPLATPLPGPFGGELLNPDWLEDVAREAGCSPKSLTFELDEQEVQRTGPALARSLRARGWGVALNADPSCPLPFGKEARSLYTELVLDAPVPLDPYLASEACVRSPLGRRIYAAKEAGIMITARDVADDETAVLLALIGFDRAGGAVAGQP